jgi:hypothetical protein
MAKNNRGNATDSASNAQASADVNDGHGDVLQNEENVDMETQRILSMVNMTAEERMLATDDADLPVVSWEDTAEVRGGNLTDMGFAKLQPGFEFRGYVLGTKKVPSEFGKDEPVLDDNGREVLDPATRKPITRRLQEVYMLKGTARFPVKGATANTFGTCAGRMTIPVYARLIEPVAENTVKEKALTEAARRHNPTAPAVHIPLHLKYVGQNPDKETASEDGSMKKSRSGAHLFTVIRLRLIGDAQRASA